MNRIEDEYRKLLNKGNLTYMKACKIKEVARKSKENYIMFLQAAEEFGNASTIYNEITTLLSKNENAKNFVYIKQECEAFSEYYLYEKEKCFTVYSYNQRDINKAKEHYKKNQKHLRNAISFLDRMERDDRLEKRLRVWEYFEKEDIPFYNSILARNAWVKNNFIEALDYYREAWEKSKQVIEIVMELVDNRILDPAYKRISIGNNIAMAVNISSAHSKLIYEKYHNNLTTNLALELLNLFLDGYCQSNKAYRANPEWDEYGEGREIIYNNICIFLNDNKKNWKDIYIKFQEKKEILNIMKTLDSKQYNKVKEEIDIGENKHLKLWGLGSFWLIAFLIVFGTISVISHNLKWYTLLCVLCFVFWTNYTNSNWSINSQIN